MSTPISAFYAGLLGVVYLYLSVLVVKNRRELKIGLGDGGDRHFRQLIRAHGNFSEYVPLVLILMVVAELNHSNSIALHVTGNALLFGRLLHAYGLRHHYGASWQRVWGGFLTFLALAVASALCLFLFYL